MTYPCGIIDFKIRYAIDINARFMEKGFKFEG